MNRLACLNRRDGLAAIETPICSGNSSRSNMPDGFSLLEVIIATAALAGSAMVLISLIGVGTRFGSKAEQSSQALTAAQTILNEYLVQAIGEDSDSEITGVTDGQWPMSYRLTITNLTAD